MVAGEKEVLEKVKRRLSDIEAELLEYGRFKVSDVDYLNRIYRKVVELLHELNRLNPGGPEVRREKRRCLRLMHWIDNEINRLLRI